MIYTSWDVECKTEIGNYGSYFALYPPIIKTKQNQNFEKMKRSAGDTIILHVFQKPQSYEVWFPRSRWNKEFGK